MFYEGLKRARADPRTPFHRSFPRSGSNDERATTFTPGTSRVVPTSFTILLGGILHALKNGAGRKGQRGRKSDETRGKREDGQTNIRTFEGERVKSRAKEGRGMRRRRERRERERREREIKGKRRGRE